MNIEEITSTTGIVKAVAHAVIHNDDDLIYRVDKHLMINEMSICSSESEFRELNRFIEYAINTMATAKQADK